MKGLGGVTVRLRRVERPNRKRRERGPGRRTGHDTKRGEGQGRILLEIAKHEKEIEKLRNDLETLTGERTGKNLAAGQLIALRQREDKACQVCGSTFRAVNTAKTCSNRCRTKLRYWRKTGKVVNH